MRRTSSAFLAVAAVGLVAPGQAFAQATMQVSPKSVHAGERVRVFGSAGGCQPGNTVTLISRAFPAKHEFAGVPAVFAKVRAERQLQQAGADPQEQDAEALPDLGALRRRQSRRFPPGARARAALSGYSPIQANGSGGVRHGDYEGTALPERGGGARVAGAVLHLAGDRRCSGARPRHRARAARGEPEQRHRRGDPRRRARSSPARSTTSSRSTATRPSGRSTGASPRWSGTRSPG